MTANWQDLQHELSQWRGEGRLATFWWRDDDAVEVTPELLRLLALADRFELRPCLAVIPALAGDELRGQLSSRNCDVAQHGYAHRNHAPAGQKSAELCAHRPLPHTLNELSAGWRVIQQFTTAAPVMVPPWNRIGDEVAAGLSGLGFAGLSTFRARKRATQHGLRIVNAHVDPVAWRGDRKFVGEPAALDQVVGHLRFRRLGEVDETEPTGLMTHHLVQDDACWSFCERLFEATRAAGGEWLGLREAFALNP